MTPGLKAAPFWSDTLLHGLKAMAFSAVPLRDTADALGTGNVLLSAE
jgi:hypothetical protein